MTNFGLMPIFTVTMREIIGAKATGCAAGKVDKFIPPGMDRSFRSVNLEFSPSKYVVDTMQSS